MSNHALIELELNMQAEQQCDLKQRLDAHNALYFLREHPAFAFENGDSLCSGLYFSMSPCCKHGYLEDARKHGVTVYQGDKHFNEFSDLLVQQYTEEELNDPSEHLSVEVPYERMFGEPWVYDHMEYWYEITFFVFEGNPYCLENNWDIKKWGRYGGPSGSANTFEEMLIKAAKDVKEVFGDFNTCDHFHTPSEKRNQSTEEFCFWLPVENEPHMREMKSNEKFVDVYNSLINLRWVEWFMTTDYAKENWKESFAQWQGFVDNIKHFEDQKRRDILAPYEV
jgi:hypothetical protein